MLAGVVLATPGAPLPIFPARTAKPAGALTNAQEAPAPRPSAARAEEPGGAPAPRGLTTTLRTNSKPTAITQQPLQRRQAPSRITFTDNK